MKLFVDTSAWFALNDRKDQHHGKAAAFLRCLKAQPVLFFTTDYVVDETVTLLRIKISHSMALSFLRLMKASPQIVHEQMTSDQLKRAEQIFARYRDKVWSFTDCASFAFMEDRGLEDAFTLDANFSQYGFRIHPNRKPGPLPGFPFKK